MQTEPETMTDDEDAEEVTTEIIEESARWVTGAQSRRQKDRRVLGATGTQSPGRETNGCAKSIRRSTSVNATANRVQTTVKKE